MYYAHYLSCGCNFGLEDEILGRLANSLVKEVRKKFIGFLDNYLIRS